MDGEILDAVTEWSTRSVSDGVSGLYDLADADFSGAVTDGTAWAFLLNGRVVGVFDGAIDDFEDASLTAYTAPDISLPLLYTMQENGGDVRGQYYSNDTPLTELDETLSSGNFVGYVELSENVLSGDYYVVYYGGRALPVAFVGNSRRRLTGDEAFERAADEVGIYSVVDADVSVVDLPERPGPDPDDTATAAGAVVGAGDGAPTDDPTAPDDDPTATDDDGAAEADSEGAPATSGTDAEETTASTPDWTTPEVAADTSEASDAVATSEATDSADDEDPETSETPAEGATAEAESPPDAGHGDGELVAETETETEPETTASGDDAPTDEPAAEAAKTPADTPADADGLRSELEAARAAKAEAEAARDRVASERDDYRAEVERLRDRIESLEAELERAKAADTDAEPAPERTLTPAEALSGTNLFVRYEDKTAGTLERAAEGRISESELRANLRLDHHTDFETEGVRVDGRPFDAFLAETAEHRFVEWLLTSLIYEIRQTSSREGLGKLYDAIERIDRIDLDGEVAVSDDATSGGDTAASFDVVFRDKMGAPLFVASFEDSREPTAASAVESLVDGARSVSESEASFAAAFLVTTSYFDAGAMETAVDATRGGLFSRSTRKSYVKLSRRAGFHLCLVEARDEDFFLTVPDL